jgi:hypothetical protein
MTTYLEHMEAKSSQPRLVEKALQFYLHALEEDAVPSYFE